MQRNNNFDTMRLLAAVSVMLSHSFPLSYGEGAAEPLTVPSHHQTSLGGVAVYVFFILSGYLITGSFERQTPGQFILARGLRLLPGLATVLVILTFLIGPLLTTESLGGYFRDGQTYRFIVTNLSLAGFTDRLPGVLETNPFPGAVDGSLWTLRFEAYCYVVVFLLGIAGLLRRSVLTVLLAASLFCSWKSIGGYAPEFGGCFLGGAVIYAWKPPSRWWIAVVCLALWGASLWAGFHLASAVVGAYVILYIGQSSSMRLPKVTRWGDLSYGTYVWAFPVQQIVTLSFGPAITWYLNLAVSVPVTLAIAALSWRFVESPALKLKKRLAETISSHQIHFKKDRILATTADAGSHGLGD
jgi:peptidoglycan/LPS O-acetylase OafA/YrhL